MKTTEVLFDTNVLCYSTDERDVRKQSIAREVSRRLRGAGAAVSQQVLSEFARSATRPHRGWLTPAEARVALADMLPSFRILEMPASTVLLALDGMERFGWNFWDAQIWATARSNGVRLVLSEDFRDGLVADDVTFRDPFAEGFHLEKVLAGLEDAKPDSP